MTDGGKSYAELERENAELRRQLEQLASAGRTVDPPNLDGQARPLDEAGVAWQARQARLATFMDQAADAFLVCDAQLRVVDANRRALEILRLSRPELIGRPFAEVMPDLPQSGQYDQYLEVLHTGKPLVIDDYLAEPRYGSLHLSVRAFRLGDGLGVLASDITELKQSEAALRKSQELLHTLVNALPDALTMSDLNGHIIYTSPRGPELLGFDRVEEVLGLSSIELIVPEQRAKAMQSLQKVLREGMDLNLRYQLIRKDGTRLPVELSSALVRGPDGEPEAFVAILRDASALQRSEALIHAQRDLALELGHVRGLTQALEVCLRAALHVSGMEGGCIYLVEEEDRVLRLSCSSGFSQQFARSHATVRRESSQVEAVFAGRPMYLRAESVEPPIQEVLRGEGLRSVGVLPVTHEGRVVGCLNVVSRQLDEVPFGNRAALEGLAAQIGTAIARSRAEQRLKESEEQLLQSQKMEAIGTLAGGIAHDFNNLLTGIVGHAGMLKRRLESDDESCQGVRAIEAAGLRAAELTGQLLGFARKGKLRHEAVDLHQVIEDVVAILRRTIDKRIRIEQETRASNPRVMGDPGQLQQVLMNLSLNAAAAMPDGGTLTLATENTSSGAPANGRLVLRVADTGTGILPEIRGRVFEPFFTTKDPGVGTGMGLAMVYGIVTNHKGTVELESEVGKGTVFVVHLPLAPAPPPLRPSQQFRRITSGNGRILLVDDERIVCDVAARMLARLGYQVHVINDGAAAVDYFLAHAGEIDLIILDLAMPVMDGQECYRRLRQVDPAVRVLVSTGYSVDGVPQEMLTQGVRGLVHKPYGMEELGRAVAAALGGPAAVSS